MEEASILIGEAVVVVVVVGCMEKLLMVIGGPQQTELQEWNP